MKSPRYLKVEDCIYPSESESLSPKYEFSNVEFVMLFPQQLVNPNMIFVKFEKVELSIFTYDDSNSIENSSKLLILAN